MNVLLTGSTGFLGAQLLRLIMINSDDVVYLLIRGKDKFDAQRKFDLVLRSLNDIPGINFERLRLVCADICIENFGLERIEYENLYQNVNCIYHCAAVTGFRLDLEFARLNNVIGVKNILGFAEKCSKFEMVHYISTVFIAGNKPGIFSESDEIDRGQVFNNTYEQSKFEAEVLIEKHKKNGVRVSIYRPSIIVGDFNSGATTNFKMFYEPLHFLSLELFDRVPADMKTMHNVVPVDVVAKSIFSIAKFNKGQGVYHILSPNDYFLGDFLNQASNYFGYRNPEFLPIGQCNLNELTSVQKKLVEPFIPYFNFRVKFDALLTSQKLSKANCILPKIDENYFERIFRYCEISGFIKRKNKRLSN